MTDGTAVPHFNVHSTRYKSLPEYGGAEAVLYQSQDKTRLAGSFKESGRHEMVMAYDEFMYLVEGTCRVTVDDADPIELSRGDCCYLTQGQTVVFEMSEDFHDVTVLISDSPIDY